MVDRLAQLRGLPDTTVVEPNLAAVQAFFGFSAWPDQIVQFDLGGRLLDIIPIPYHEATSIAVYDRQTGVLFTGNTFSAHARATLPPRATHGGREALRRAVARAAKESRRYQAELAEMTRVPQNHISTIERGAKLPTLRTLIRFAAALDCKVSNW